MSPVNGSSKSPFKRIGLSEYTSQRLAELKARRAEADEEMKASPKSKETETDLQLERESNSEDSLSLNYSPTKQQESKPDPCCREDHDVRANDGRPVEIKVLPALPDDNSILSEGHSQLSSGESSTLIASKVQKVTRTSVEEVTTKVDDDGDYDDDVCQRVVEDANETKESISSALLAQDNCSANNQILSNPYANQMNCENTGFDGDYVGFASLPDQVHRKAVKKGFDFTLMVVGESGLGKSTLVSSLFQNSNLYKNRVPDRTHDLINKTVSIEKKVLEIEEKGVRLKLTIIDTPGFSDSLDNTGSWKTISDYIDEQYQQYFRDESGLNRRSINDSRVHCCLVFLSPLGRGIRQSEIALMKQLQSRVNLIPVIAKSDTLTTSEIKKLKEKILDDARKHDVKFYELPECDSDEDEEFVRQDKELKAAIPFAIIGSNAILDIGGKKIRGRMYPWGIVDVDNPKHCDFSKLRQFLIGTHMQDLKDVTHEIHYENYRASQLQEQLKKTQKDRRLKRCSDSTEASDKISNADHLIRQKEEEIERMKEMLKAMQNKLAGNKTKPSPV